MEGTIKYVNPEQKYGYIKAEGEHDISFKMKEGREYPLNAHVTFDLIVLENSRRYADNIVLQEHGPRKHGKLKISNPYAPSKIENQIAENKESCAIISELISKSRGTKETVFPFNDYAYLPTYYQHRPENQWLIGKPSGYWINGNSLLYLKIKKQIRYQGTTQGNGIMVPKYGCDSLLLEPLPLMRCYSGSFIRAEVRRGRAERVYLDFFPDEQTEAFLRLSEQLEKMLSEQLAEKKRTMH